MKNIVTIGGGTGSYTLLLGLKKYEDINITAIVSMADDGGSTGRLRDELGVLPAGDVRQCLVALSEHTETVRELMNYRFEEGGLSGHNFGNILLAALEKVAGSFAKGLKIASEILKIKGHVVPVTEDSAKLAVKLCDGKVLVGENSINHADTQTAGIDAVYYEEPVTLSRDAKDAMYHADLIILGPGNFYCSILPNLVVDGFKEALLESRAHIVMPVNLTNKKGHTEHWKTSNYVEEIEKYIGKKVDIILVNNESPSPEQVAVYQLEEGSGVLVENDMDDERVLKASLLSKETVRFNPADQIASVRSFIRHDSDKLAKEIMALVA